MSFVEKYWKFIAVGMIVLFGLAFCGGSVQGRHARIWQPAPTCGYSYGYSQNPTGWHSYNGLFYSNIPPPPSYWCYRCQMLVYNPNHYHYW